LVIQFVVLLFLSNDAGHDWAKCAKCLIQGQQNSGCGSVANVCQHN
jgi:hypothetical protein